MKRMRLASQSKRRITKAAFSVLLLATTFPLPLFGQTQDVELGSGPSFAYLILKVVLALVVTGGFAVLTVMLIRRFMHPGATGELREEVRLVGSVGLAPKKQIFLVRCFDRLLVIGATDSQMTLLSEVTDPNLIAEIDRQRPKGAAARWNGALLKKLAAQ
jgi:flagellar biogenesis protein FliO